MESDVSKLLLLFARIGPSPRIRKGRKKPTWPAMEPSWADLPLTVKVTPLGALDLTSRLARSLLVDVLWMKRTRRTRAGVVEVLVQELLEVVSAIHSLREGIFQFHIASYIIGRLGDVRESSGSRHDEYV
jgi:hypothetical protein